MDMKTNYYFMILRYCIGFFLLLFFLFSEKSSAQQTTFRINYDFNNFDFSSTAGDALTNGNYVLVGWNTNIIPLTATITEVNSAGNLVWSRRYTSSISMQINDLKRDVASNTYYACGGTETGGAFIMILNAAGTPTISRNFSIAQADGAFLNRIVKTSDGGYVAVGYVTGYDPDGAGPEIKFSSITYTDADGNSQTERIGSPLIVKFDANGNHLWHRVTRYYKNSGKAPADRIYNDASFTDVVEVNDGYIAVGMYDVNDFRTNTNSDGDDATSNDALFLKTTTAGAITYHRQIDAPSTTATASSKRLYSIKKTGAGLPILAGEDGSSMLFMRLAASGGWANPTWIRRYSTSGFLTTMIVSNFFETFDGNYAAIGQYLNPLAFQIGQGIIKINPSNNSVIFGRSYDLGLFSILPNGSATADRGFISATLGQGGTNFDMQIVKTDSAGNAPADCPAANLSTSNNAPSYTYADPHYNSWNANTVNNSSFTPTVTTPTPGVNVLCRTIACTPPPTPTVSASPNNVCPGTPVTISASGGTNVTYRVYTQASGGTSIGAAPLQVSPNTTTTYYVEADDNANAGCVSARASVVVTVLPAAPTQATISGNNSVCPGIAEIYSVNSPRATTYNWSVPAQGNITGGQGTNQATINWTTVGGPYTISVTTSNSCGSVTGTYQVTVQSGPPTSASIVGQTNVCPGSETYTATAAGASTFNWSISGGGTFSSPQNANPVTVNWTTPGGPYTLSVTASNGCGNTGTTIAVTVSSNPPTSTGPITGDSPVCVGTAQYTVPAVTGATGYTWSVSGGGFVSAGQNTNNATINWISGGNYTVSVTADNLCGSSTAAILNVEVVANPPATPGAITGASPVCAGNHNYSIAAVPGATSYQWNIGFPLTLVSGQGTNNITVSFPAVSGTFPISVVAENACGSSAASTTNVTVIEGAPAAPSIISGNDNPCPGISTYTTTPIANAVSYQWTLSGGGNIISGQGTISIEIDWTTDGGPYALSVVAENICGTSLDTTLIIHVQPGVALVVGHIDGDTSLCPGETGSYTIQPVQGATGYSWTASSGGNILTGQGTESITVAWNAPNSTQTVSVIPSSNCSSSQPQSLSINIRPDAPNAPLAITGQTTSCGGEATYTTGLVLHATDYQWTLSGGGTIVSGQGTEQIVIDWGNVPGTYTITLIASNDCGSSTPIAHTVTVQPPAPDMPAEILGDLEVCAGTATFTVNPVTNATGYTWSVPSGATITNGQGSNTVTINFSSEGNYTISITAGNTCGNSAVQTANVVVHPVTSVPNVSVNNPSICFGQSATITVSGSSGGTVSYHIYDSPTATTPVGSSPFTVTPSTTTVYYIDAENEFGCRLLAGRIPINITVLNAAQILKADDKFICEGASAVLTAEVLPVNSEVTWWDAMNGGNLLGTGLIYITPILNTTTSFYVDARSDNDCGLAGAREEVIVNVQELPVITLISDKEDNAVFPGEVITITALPDGLDSYEFFINDVSFQFGSENFFASSKLKDNDTITVIARDGDCLSKPEHLVIQLRDFPNAFTPNGDGKNDFFLKNYDLIIMNRWGQELYRGIDGWDGTYKGNKVSPGTYFYILTLQDITDRDNIVKGTVLLIQE